MSIQSGWIPFFMISDRSCSVMFVNEVNCKWKFFNCVFQAVELKLFSHQNYSLGLARNLVVSGFGSHDLVFFTDLSKKDWFLPKGTKILWYLTSFQAVFYPLRTFVHKFSNFSVFSVHRTWIFFRLFSCTCTFVHIDLKSEAMDVSAKPMHMYQTWSSRDICFIY